MGSFCLATLSEVLLRGRSFSSVEIHFFKIGKLSSESGSILIFRYGSCIGHLVYHNIASRQGQERPQKKDMQGEKL